MLILFQHTIDRSGGLTSEAKTPDRVGAEILQPRPLFFYFFVSWLPKRSHTHFKIVSSKATCACSCSISVTSFKTIENKITFLLINEKSNHVHNIRMQDQI